MLLSAENLSFGFNGGSLLENLCFSLNEGDRVGLIGANGEGKTTLIRLILGELDPESGTLFRKNGIRICYLAQTGGYDSYNTIFEENVIIEFAVKKKVLPALEARLTEMSGGKLKMLQSGERFDFR